MCVCVCVPSFGEVEGTNSEGSPQCLGEPKNWPNASGLSTALHSPSSRTTKAGAAVAIAAVLPPDGKCTGHHEEPHPGGNESYSKIHRAVVTKPRAFGVYAAETRKGSEATLEF